MRLFIAPLLLACVPKLDAPGNDEVPLFNYGLAELKDSRYASCPFGAIDDVMTKVDGTGFMDLNGLVGCSVGVAEGGQIVYLQSYGMADAQGGASDVMSIERPLPVGSVAKTLTAMGIMALFEDGEIVSLDDPASNYVTFPAWWHPWVDTVTLRQLLSHTSGIEDGQWVLDPVLAYPNALTFTGDAHQNPRVTLYGMDSAPNASAPPNGAVGRYSNIGYQILAAVIDTIVTDNAFGAYGPVGTQPGFESYVWWVANERGAYPSYGLVTPALNSALREASGDLPGLPLDYEYDTQGGQLNPGSPWVDPLWGWEAGAGGWTLTIGDLTRLGLAIGNYDGADPRTLLDQDTWKQMALTQAFSLDKPPGRYGMGINQIQWNGKWFRGHPGQTRDYVAAVYHVGSEDRTYAFACNTSIDGGGAYYSTLIPALESAYSTYRQSNAPTAFRSNCVGSPNLTPLEVASEHYADKGWPQVVSMIHRYGQAGAELLLRNDWSHTPYEQAVVDAIDNEDFDRAAECYLSVMGNTHGTWTCPLGGTGGGTGTGGTPTGGPTLF